ncbi:odorant receptor 13a-like [Colletes latitarsis]|uniref:odorant receptor 13a-like n=1 Tax=Colletes latitarsis TaxID=2605962 RepID=UPI00403736B9
MEMKDDSGITLIPSLVSPHQPVSSMNIQSTKNDKRAIFTNCIIRVERDWKAVDNANDRNIMLKYATISRTLITACAIFIYTGGLFYQALTHFFQKFTPKRDNVTRTLSYPGYDKLFDTQASPTFEIIHFLHYLSGFLKYTITTASYSLAVICVTHICGQIQIQISRLENLVEETKQNSTDNTYFANIIERHAEILSFSRNVEVALREICLTTIVECTLVLCLLEYYCLTEWPNSDMIPIFTYAVLMLSFTFNIFIFNYIGELLSEKCSQIGQTSYEIDWYTLPPKKASYLILVHAVSLYPPKLTGGKIFVLSLYTFGTVMKSSVVYLNLLRTISE